MIVTKKDKAGVNRIVAELTAGLVGTAVGLLGGRKAPEKGVESEAAPRSVPAC